MIEREEIIPDPYTDSIGLLLKKLNSLQSWTKEKHQIKDDLVKLLDEERYISFRGDGQKYYVSRVGQSFLYRVPEDRRGNLSVFRGHIIRIVCVGTGTYGRVISLVFRAGKTSSALAVTGTK